MATAKFTLKIEHPNIKEDTRILINDILETGYIMICTKDTGQYKVSVTAVKFDGYADES